MTSQALRFDDKAALIAAAGRRTSSASARFAGGLSFSSKASREAAGLGLVYSSTSVTDYKGTTVLLDKNHIRSTRLKKAIITGARLHDQEAKKGSTRGAWYMLTTTYRPGAEYSPRDISYLLSSIRRFFNRFFKRRNGAVSARFRYLWVGELTKALVPHYHLLVWVPKGLFIPKVDRMGWWPHGLTKFEKARNAVGYLAKYASKFTGAMAEAFPTGFRTHGVGGLGDESKRELRWWKAPEDARKALGDEADIRKVSGGYADKRTGDFWPSPWRVYFDKGRLIAYRFEVEL